MAGKFRIHACLLLLFGAATAAEAQRATITGRVTYQGPELKTELPVAEDARQYCGTTTSVQRLIDRGALSNVVVFLEGVPSVDMKGKPIELRSDNCDFAPAVQVAETGAHLELANHDPMLHVVQMYRSGVRVGEFALRGEGGNRTDRRLLKGPGLINVQCRSHKWMHSNIWVFDHPYYALTGKDGTFQLPLVVPGAYKLTVWHAELGVQTRDITVTADQVLPVEFVYQRAVAQ